MKYDDFVKEKLKGILIPIMPAFFKNGDVDYDSTLNYIEWCMSKGIKNFWTTGGTTHYFCLSDKELVKLNRKIAEITKGKAVFMAATNYHWPVHTILEFGEEMKKHGGDILKIQIGWNWNPSPEDVFSFYKQTAGVLDMPALAYTLGKPGVTPKLLEKLLTIENLVGMKNDSGDFYENCQYWNVIRKSKRCFQMITGGTMSSYFHARNFGQKIFADVVAMYAPEVTFRFCELLQKDNTKEAVEIMKKYEEPILYGGFYDYPGKYWTVYHTILYLLKLFKSNYVRFPLKTLKPDFSSVKKYIPECERYKFLT